MPATRGEPASAERFMYQYKMSLPLTCPILALIGLALGATNRKDGKLASFVLGIGVIFVYYVLLWGARAVAMGGRFNPDVGAVDAEHRHGHRRLADDGLALAVRRSADSPERAGVLGSLDRCAGPCRAGGRQCRRPARHVASYGHPGPAFEPADAAAARHLPGARVSARCSCSCMVGLLGVFYIATFIDLVDKLFRGDATTRDAAASIFYFRTPQYVYYVIPMAVLVATLVTIGVMTKNSELLVMRACGISLYRSAAPLLLFGALASGGLCLLQERVLAPANREADRLNRVDPAMGTGHDPAQPALDRRPRRRDVPLRRLRSAGQSVHRPVGLPARRAGMASGFGDPGGRGLRRTPPGRRTARCARLDRAPRLDAQVGVGRPPPAGEGSARNVSRQLHDLRRAGAVARSAKLFQDRRADRAS